MADFNLLDPSTWPSVNAPTVQEVKPQLSQGDLLKADLAQIQAGQNDPNAQAAIALSEQRGNGLTESNQLLNDFDALSRVDFQQKYGLDVYRTMVGNAMGSREFLAGAEPERDLGEVVADGLTNAAGGFNKAMVGLAAAPAQLLWDGPVKESVLEWQAGANADIDARTKRLQSDELNQRQYVDSVRTALDDLDNTAAAAADKGDDKNFVDNLASYGREILADAASKGTRLIEDPNMIGTIASEGVGSMIAGGAVAKGIGAASRVLAGATPGSKLLTPAGSKVLDEATTSAAFAPTIAAMEGSGAAGQAYDAVMKMDPLKLIESPEYQAYIREGMSPEDARSRLAADAARIAFAPAAAVGAVTGKLVEKIELAPFAKTNAGGLAVNAGKETLEESVQSASGQIAGNAGVNLSGADRDQDLLEGVGDAVVEGAVGGAGTTLLTQGPGAALSVAGKTAVAAAKGSVPIAVGTAKVAGAGLTAALKMAGVVAQNTLGKAGEKVEAARAAASPTSPENMAPAVQEAVVEAPKVAEGLKTMATEAGTKSEDVDAFIAKVQEASSIQDDDFTYMPAVVGKKLVAAREELGRMPNRFEALDIAAVTAADETASPEDRIGAATFILKSTAANKKLFQNDLPEFLEKIPQDREEFQRFNQYSALLTAIEQTPAIQKALKIARQIDLSTVDLTTDEGKKIVGQTVELAVVAPTEVSPAVIDEILNQAGSDASTLTPAQRRILKSLQVLNQAGQSYVEDTSEGTVSQASVQEQTKRSNSKSLDFVTRQIESDGGEKGNQLSLVQHVQTISEAEAAGDKKLIKERVTKLTKFAMSHSNKLAAINRSIRTGDQNVKYTAADPNGVGYTPKKGVGVRIGNAGQERFARAVQAEAMAIARLANSYIAEHPELNLKPIVVPALALDSVKNGDKKGSSTTAPVASAPSQATTSRTDDTSKQSELPSEPTQVEATQDAVVQDEPAEVAEVVSTKAETETIAEVAPEPVIDEPVIDETSNEEPIKDPTIAEAFPDLVQPKGRNFFHSAFRFPRIKSSRMLGVTGPLNALFQALRGGQSIVDFMDGKDVKYAVDAPDAAAMRDLLEAGGDVLAEMKRRLKDVLTAKTKDGGTLLTMMNNGTQLNQWRRYRILNILEKTDKGYRYNQPLMETAIVAGLDWVMNAADRVAEPSRNDVAGLLGIPDDEVTQKQIEAFKRGLSLDSAARSLAENIVKFWGVQSQRDELDDYVKGIPEAVAKEILYGLADAGLIELGILEPLPKDPTEAQLREREAQEAKGLAEVLTFPEAGPKIFNRVRFDKRSPDTKNLLKSLNGVHNLLADMALIDREIEGYRVGEGPIKEIDKTQLHNPMVPLTAQQKKALENTQATPHYPNLQMFDLVMGMGLEAFVTLMSGRPYSEGDLTKTHKEMGLNKGHWESVKGLQRSLASSYENIQKQMDLVKGTAKAQGIPVEQVATYYRHHINKLGRTQMGGLSNPQSDKLAREIFMPTRSVLDLSNQENSDFAKFLMTVGQGIGLKTEKETRSVVGEKVIAATMSPDGALRPLVEGLKAWLTARDNGGSNAIPAEVSELLTQAGLSMHGMHSLISVARYELAKEAGQDLSKFETSNYLEADGKTNGPINSLLLYGAGLITPLWLKAAAKGGAFFGQLGENNEGKTLNSHREDGVPDGFKDLYQTGAEGTEKRVAELGKEIEASSDKAHELFMSFKRFLSALSVDVEQDPKTGDITIKRGTIKNPLTITIYGSGAAGIAGKVTDELMSAVYEKLSQSVAEGVEVGDLIYPEAGADMFMMDLVELTSKSAAKNEEGEWSTKGRTIPIGGSALDFELSPQQYRNLKSNIEKFLVNPMRKSIGETVTKHVSAVTDTMQQSTQIQSIILKGMFIDKITNRLAMKQADPETWNYTKGEFLSQQELEDILKSLVPFSPVIETGTQSYYLSGGEKADLFDNTTISVGGETFEVSYPKTFSLSLDGKMQTPAFVNGPTLSGVKAIPTLVVGSGDGQMMLYFLSENTKGSANRVEHVFDGLNMPADSIDEYSRMVNQAVFKTWTSATNPVRAAYESFAAFMERNPIEVLFGDGPLNAQQELARRELTQVIQGSFKIDEAKISSPAEAMVFAEKLLADMKNLAEETDARRRVYAEFPFSVDQMASAESPFVNVGNIELPADASYEQIADAMNERYQHHLAEIRGEKRQSSVAEAVNKIGGIDFESVNVVSAEQIPALLKELSDKLTPTQKEMMRNAARLLKGSGYRIVFGPTSELDAWEQRNNPERFVPGSNSQMGKIDPVSKIILISNMEAETVIHELVHAATIDKVRAFYANPKSLSAEERAAVERLEGLMQEWRALDPGKETGDGYEARGRAEAEIDRRLNKGQKAEALNEFMAWVLGNQDLAVLAQKTKVKNPAWRIIGDALAALKTIIWGGANKGPRVGDSLLSNLRFNTRVLMAGITPVEQLQADSDAVVLYQSKSFGDNDRLTEVRKRLNSRIIAWLDGDGTSTDRLAKERRINEDLETRRLTGQLTGQFAFHFTDMKTMQAASTFAAVQRALMTGIDLNANALSRVQDLYDHVIGQLKYTDFMKNPDGENIDPDDEAQARAKHDLILGKFNTITDKFGRSSLMSSFLALAMTSGEFREVLSKLAKPKSDKSTAKGLDGLVESVGTGVVDLVSTMIAGESRKDGNIRDAIDSLTAAMIDNVGDQRSYIERFGENGIDKIEKVAADFIQDKSALIAEKAAEINRTTKSRMVKVGASVVSVMATAINEQKSTAAAEGLVSQLNQVDGWEPIKSLVSDLVGRTKDNAPIFDMISKVRTVVQQVRQQFRDELPKKLNRMFTKPVSAEQWTAMFKALGKTDLAAITGSYGLDGALEMITDDQRRAREIAKLEKLFGPELLAKSKQLANYMVTGQQGVRLLRNAYAISALAVPKVKNLKPTEDMVEEIDRLVTLYAIDQTDPEALEMVNDLIQNEEKAGVEFVTSYLMGQRVDELAKVANTPRARINAYKGNIPSESQNKGSLIIASDSEYAQLVGRGYTRVGAYTGSTADRSLGKRSYYFAPVSGRAPFSQGVLQTVHQTASGVDPETGFTTNEIMAGRIEDPQAIQVIERLLANQAPGTENLLPVFNEQGQVIAFERAADPAMLARLDRSTNLAEMIGVWRGRQAEELMAQEVNRQLVDELKGIWDKGVKDGKQKEFVNIADLDPDTADKILVEAASLVPAQTIKYVREVFGDGTLMVRRDMLLDTFGARQASVGDLFSGNTRWNPKVAREFEKVITGIFGTFGKDAFTTLVGSEQNIQDVVANVKQTIVVKSVIVPVANMVSNMVQLMNRGVPLRAIIHGVGAKTAEINSYVKRRQREIDLEADLRAAEGKNDTGSALKIGNQIQSIRDSYRRMSIWPLIEAGEFSAISSGQVTAEDLAIVDGKWSNFIEKKVNELNEPFKTMARYGLVTKDTALFQGLARAVQYGDFVAKSVLYEDLTSRKKVSKKEAVATVNEAFVNYNRLGGRNRQYLESVGLLWFYSYKLRIIKEAAYMLRHNPLRSLLAVSLPPLPLIGDIGTPMADNAVALLNDGKLGFSIGPNMAFGSWQLNPWINAVR